MLGHRTRQPLGAVVDQDIKPRHLVAHLFRRPGDFARIRQIEDEGLRPLAGALVNGFGGRIQGFAGASGHDDLGAQISEHHCKSRAQPAASARDDGGFAGEALSMHGLTSLGMHNHPERQLASISLVQVNSIRRNRFSIVSAKSLATVGRFLWADTTMPSL